MAESDQESTCNTDDLISGVYRLDDISPLLSPCSPNLKPRTHQNLAQEKDSGRGSSSETPVNTCFEKSNLDTVRVKPISPRSRSLSPQSRIRVHYTDSAQEALDLANKSYEKLVEEADERHKLSILINKRDAEKRERELERAELERAELERAELERRELDKKEERAKAADAREVDTAAASQSSSERENRPPQPITIIQEHIKFAESILASPPSSEAGSRSRSLSPFISNHQAALPLAPNHSANRSRSTSPISRGRDTHTTSSRKRLAFENEGSQSKSPLLSRSGREKTAQQIRTQATNAYIEATSQGLHHPRLRYSSGRMSSPSHSTERVTGENAEELVDIYSTPEQNAVRAGPLSSTPHKSQRAPVRRAFSLRDNGSWQTDSNQARSSAEPVHTPTHYIKGLQSVRSGLRRLMGEELPGVDLITTDPSNRSDSVGLRIESTINAENQLLRDQLSRERSLRKQIEADKHELQSQLLESKDRLHHLTSTLKQKDGMMKKLDQNLEDVVKGWQKHEHDNKLHTENLTINIRRLERELEDKRQQVLGLESDLTSTIEDLRREQNTSKDFAREASEQQTHYQEELTNLNNCLEREREKGLRLELEKTQAVEGRGHVEGQLSTLHETLDQERENFKEREQELLSKINEITSVQIAVLEQEAARTKALNEKIEELDEKARKCEQEAEGQRHLVSSREKELERLQSLLELTEAKHQNSLQQLESKLRVELELRVSQAKDDGLKRVADVEIALQQAHQRQLSDVASEHNRQLGAMRERFNNEINRVKNHMEDQIQMADAALEDTKRELESAQSSKEAAEGQRDDLASRLQAVLTLLGAAGQGVLPASSLKPAPLSSDYGSSATLSHQVSTNDISQGPQVFAPYKERVEETRVASPPPSDRGSKDTPYQAPVSVSSTQAGDTSDELVPNNDGSYEMPINKQPGQQEDVSAEQSEDFRQQYETHRQQMKEEQEQVDEKVEGTQEDKDDASVVSTTETYDLNDNDDSHYRHKRQAELQDYIKKLLNRSVGDPLIETRIDLDESHISVISGLQEHSVILHDGSHHHHSSPKKAFRHETVGHVSLGKGVNHTPPVKGSSKKVNPTEIASLISKYGSGSTPSTSEYLEYLKSVAVNNHTGLLREFGQSKGSTGSKQTAKKALADTFNTSASIRVPPRRSTSRSRVTPSSPESTTLSKQAKEKDRAKIKRHSSTRSQAVWK